MISLNKGADNYAELVSSDGKHIDPNKLFVDKTLFIKEFFNSFDQVLLITRPRRWGKTLNLSMLEHFFAEKVRGQLTENLFKGLQISQDKEMMNHQGKWPVIFVSFKDLKGDGFSEIYSNVKNSIANLYEKHEYILKALEDCNPSFKYQSEKTYEKNENKFNKIMLGTGDDSDCIDSLRFLSELMSRFYNKKCFILIDEYDNAINHAFEQSEESLKKLTDLFGNMFGRALKTNDYLQKGLITGILRLARANIFSGLNNLGEYTVLHDKFSEFYGFTEREVTDLLARTNINNSEGIKQWYNGYKIGGFTIYNPWSIMNCIANNGKLEPYWVDSANPVMIRNILLDNSSVEDKQKLKCLLNQNKKEIILDTPLEKYISMEQIKIDPSIMWSLLVHTGYLACIKDNGKESIMFPNMEITERFKKQIRDWFNMNKGMDRSANYILGGDIEGFLEEISKEINNPAYSARMFSGVGSSSGAVQTIALKEFMYQFLIMTQLRCINAGNDDHQVIAEPYIGIGKTRADFFVINKEYKTCVVGEIKVSSKKEKLAEDAEKKALKQIEEKQYGKDYRAENYQVIKLGIAFKGSDFAVAYKMSDSDEIEVREFIS